MKRSAPALGVLVALGAAMTTLVLAQPRHPQRPRPRQQQQRSSADAGVLRADGSAGAVSTPDATVPQVQANPDAGASSDASTVLRAQLDPDAGTISLNDAAIPLRQLGHGTVLHYPIPEQLARTAVPVFAQVRSSAPIDHVSVFYRGVGATRYTELRMTAMGQQFRLPSGYGASIPCDDIFPPHVEYFVQAFDSSGAPNGTAGTASHPIEVSIVEHRSFPAPTLPGQAPPRSCGSLAQRATSRDAGASSSQPTRGSADLGEPCRTNNDCRNGLRCGSTHTCLFEPSH